MKNYPGTSGNDVFNVPVLAEDATVTGAGGTDTLNIDWSTITHNIVGESILSSGVINKGSLDGFGNAGFRIDFTSIERLNIKFGSGDDDFRLSNPQVIAQLDGRGGSDRLELTFHGATPITFTLASQAGAISTFVGQGTTVKNIENISLNLGEGADRITLGAGGDSVFDRDGNDIVSTGGGTDVVNAGPGNDLVDGGAGNDDLVGGDGVDTVSYATATGAITISLASQYVSGGQDTGGSGIDSIGDFENLTGSAYGDTLTGDSMVNVLKGGGGADKLDGGGSADRMEGGAADDLYVVDTFTVSTATPDDVVVELVDGGTDTVNSLVTYVLAANVENLVLLGSSAINGTGNDLANLITGNGAANSLVGGGGNDILDGKGGVDTMTGGDGNDLYRLIISPLTPTAPADAVIEAAGGGTDTVEAGGSYTLPANVEHLLLTGNVDRDGTGNGLANRITGNSANNVLTGGAGNDTLRGGGDADTLNGDAGFDTLDGGSGADIMAGGADHDTYIVDQAGDQVIEAGNSGTDTVQSLVSYTLPTHVEKLVLTGTSATQGSGNSAANTITGNGASNVLNGASGNDVIDAGAGNDRIFGGAGNDSLKGGTGLDRFEFTTALGATNVDKILDYSVVSDTVYLHRSVFTRAGANGALAASAFHQGTAAADAADRIVYDQATGKISYDSDGNGAAASILFATVTPGTALTSADFMIYG